MATALLVALNYVGVGGSASAPGPRARVLDRVFPGPPVSLPFSWRSEEKQGSDGDQRVESIPAGVEPPSDFKVPAPLSTPYVVRP